MCSGGMAKNRIGTMSNGLQVVGDPNSTDEGMNKVHGLCCLTQRSADGKIKTNKKGVTFDG